MRHKRKGRVLGRNSSHRRALFRNLASALFLTERDEIFYEGLYQPDGKVKVQPPKHKGRIVTTLHKAKEVRPLVEKCITIAAKALAHEKAAVEFETTAERNSDEWKKWRKSDNWQKWNQAMAPAVNARRRVQQLICDKEAVQILFEDIAPRFVDRPGGYTRILKMAQPRLGDAGAQGILELVGVNDRVSTKSEKPSFGDDAPADDAPAKESAAQSVDDEAAASEGDEAKSDDAAAEEKTE